MEDTIIGSLSTQSEPTNCLGKIPPKRSIFPEYWRQADRIRSDLGKRPASPLTLSTHSKESLHQEMVVNAGSVCCIPKKITLPIAITTPPRNGSIQRKSSFLDSPPRHGDLTMSFTIPNVPRRRILPQRRIYTTSSIPSELEQAKSPSLLWLHSSERKLEDPSSWSSPSSCIRESRFSGRGLRMRSSSTVSERSIVRFDMKKVDVVDFDKPKETYSEEGWAELFTL